MGDEPTWTTKDDRKIPISELEDEHLRNIHRFLRQQIENVKFYARVIGTIWAPRGDMAQDAFDNEFDNAEAAALIARSWLDQVIGPEMTRRNLKEKPLRKPYKPMPVPKKVTKVNGGTIAEF